MSIVQIQLRRDLLANWVASNPILAQGELALEMDTSRFKVGDGATAWNSLGYAFRNASNVTETYVDLDGMGDYTLLEDAIGDLVGTGATIRVGPGIHVANLQNVHNLTIRGSGIGRTIIRDDDPGAGGIFQLNDAYANGDFRLSDCTLRLTQATGGNCIGVLTNSTTYVLWVDRVKIEVDCPSARASTNDAFIGVLASSPTNPIVIRLNDVWIDFSNVFVGGDPEDTPTCIPVNVWNTSTTSVITGGFFAGDAYLNTDMVISGAAALRLLLVDPVLKNGAAALLESLADTVLGRYVDGLTKKMIYPGSPPFGVDSTTLVTNLNSDKVDGADLSTDGTMAANSNVLFPSQAAAKTYSDTKVPKVSTARPGVIKLYRRDHDSGYSMQMGYDGTRWLLQGYDAADAYHGPIRVAYADAANNSNVLEGYSSTQLKGLGATVYRNSGAQNIVSGWNTIVYQSYLQNTMNGWDGSTAIYAQRTGWHLLFFNCTINPSANTDNIAIQILVSGGAVVFQQQRRSSTTQNTSLSAFAMYYLTASTNYIQSQVTAGSVAGTVSVGCVMGLISLEQA